MSSGISFTVEIAWTGNVTGVFRIGTSTLGGTDVLAGTFGGYAYDDLTAEVKSFETWRGRDSDLATMRKGSATITLADSTGKYNIENAASPLAAYLDVMRPVRIRATYSGTTYGVFYGWIERIEHNPDRAVRESVITCVDFMEWLEMAKPTVASTGATTVGGAIGKILDALEWTETSMRSLDNGDSISDFSADGSKSATTLIEELLVADRGVCFPSQSGVVTYLDRDAHWRAKAVDGSVTGGIARDARPGIDLLNVINRQTVTKTGSTAQTATDEPSRKSKGYRDGSPITSAYLASDAQALSLASFLVAIQKNGKPRVQPVRVVSNGATAITQQLARELGDLLSVSEPVGGTSFNGTIEGIRQHYDAKSLLLGTTFLVVKRPASGFTIGVSTLDGGDVLVY